MSAARIEDARLSFDEGSPVGPVTKAGASGVGNEPGTRAVRSAASILAERLRAFHAICDVWDTAVATGLPDAERLRVELARLQEHADLLSISEIEERSHV